MAGPGFAGLKNCRVPGGPDTRPDRRVASRFPTESSPRAGYCRSFQPADPRESIVGPRPRLEARHRRCE
jgi:hypothetical protein